MPVGGQPGNNNSSKNNRIWANTIKRVIAQEDYKQLRKIAEKLVELAAEGDMSAIKEIGDRIDGKSVQAIDANVDMQLTVNILRFADNTPEQLDT